MALTSVVAHSLLFFHLVTGLRSAAKTHTWTAQFGNNDIYGGVYADPHPDHPDDSERGAVRRPAHGR